jgi:hypothetical protein
VLIKCVCIICLLKIVTVFICVLHSNESSRETQHPAHSRKLIFLPSLAHSPGPCAPESAAANSIDACQRPQLTAARSKHQHADLGPAICTAWTTHMQNIELCAP